MVLRAALVRRIVFVFRLPDRVGISGPTSVVLSSICACVRHSVLNDLRNRKRNALSSVTYRRMDEFLFYDESVVEEDSSQIWAGSVRNQDEDGHDYGEDTSHKC